MSQFVKMLKEIVRDKDAHTLFQQALGRRSLHNAASKVPDDIVTALLVQTTGRNGNISSLKQDFAKSVSENLALRNNPVLINNPEFSARILIKFCCALSMSGIFPGKYKKFRNIGEGMGCIIDTNSPPNTPSNISNTKPQNRPGNNGQLDYIYDSIMHMSSKGNGFDEPISMLANMITTQQIRKFEQVRPIVDRLQDILYEAYVNVFKRFSGNMGPPRIPIQYEQLLSKYSGASNSNIRLNTSKSPGGNGVHESTLNYFNMLFSNNTSNNTINPEFLLRAYQIINLYRRYAQKKYNLFLGKSRGYGGRINIRNMRNISKNTRPLNNINNSQSNTRSVNNRSVNGRSVNNRSANGRSVGNRSVDNRSANGRSAGNRSVNNRSVSNRSVSNRSASNRSPNTYTAQGRSLSNRRPNSFEYIKKVDTDNLSPNVSGMSQR